MHWKNRKEQNNNRRTKRDLDFCYRFIIIFLAHQMLADNAAAELLHPLCKWDQIEKGIFREKKNNIFGSL